MQTYRCISLTEPWATLLASGKKNIETRPIDWSYRKPILIHASARIDPLWRRIVDGEREAMSQVGPDATYIVDALRSLGINNHTELPRGCILGLSEIKMSFQFTSDSIRDIKYPERAFGDYTLGRWGLVMPETRLLAEPIPAKGALGLWNWESPEPLNLLPVGSRPPAYVARDVMKEPQLTLF